MEWVLIGILTVLALWLYLMLRRSYAYRVKLGSYAAFLLLDDEVRIDHQVKLKEYIREAQVTDVLDLSKRTLYAIEGMVDGWDELVSGAHALIRQEKRAQM